MVQLIECHNSNKSVWFDSIFSNALWQRDLSNLCIKISKIPMKSTIFQPSLIIYNHFKSPDWTCIRKENHSLMLITPVK